MRTLLMIVLAIFVYVTKISAQDVNGVQIDFLMTKEQVVEKFGEPLEYIMEDYSEMDGIYEWYSYEGGDYLRFIDGNLNTFYVSTDRWPVLANMIEGGVRVGDPLSKLSSLNPKIVDWVESSHTYYIPFGDFPLLIDVCDGMITSMSYQLRLI